MSVTSGYTDQVQVEEETETETRTMVSLDKENADLTKEHVLLEDALEVEVLSNVNWKLVASVQDSYLDYSRDKLASNPKPNIWVKAANRGFVRLKDLDRQVTDGEGSFQKQEFEISYRIGLPQESGFQITGAGADVYYTLMQL